MHDDSLTDRSSLADWLSYIGRVHPRSIEMGLDRIRRVRLDPLAADEGCLAKQ